MKPCKELNLSSRIYDTWERNQLTGILKDCSSCSKNRRIRCQKKRDQTIPTPTGQPKQRAINAARRIPKPKIEPQTINRRVGFTVTPKTNREGQPIKKQNRKDFTLTKIQYGRTVDRYKELIHD